MIGLFELGNTALKVAFCKSAKSDKLDNITRLVYAGQAARLHQLLAQSLPDWPVVEQAFVASVAKKETLSVLERSLKAQGVARVRQVHSRASQLGVHSCYSQPETLGIDRWLALIAFRNQTKKSGVIIDAGTALTIDVINNNGQHQGGLILPGLQTMRASLLAKTNMDLKLNETDLMWKLACNSESAVLQGTLYSIVSSIDQIVDVVDPKTENNFMRIITGGDAEKLLPLLNKHYQLETNLTLNGLLSVAMSEL